MSILCNRIPNKKLRECMLNDTTLRYTISFYKYFYINNPQDFRDRLYLILSYLKVFGRIYIANEGINAQISVPRNHFEEFRIALYAFYSQLNDLRLNIALNNDEKSFWVLRMKVRKNIVADGINDATFNPTNIGKCLKIKEVNELSDDPNVLFIDMRNHYEYEVGHFIRAIEIPSDTFRNQIPMVIEILKNYKDKKIVMYCTGGIRCEKASAWMLHNGFSNVYHIEGGIIQYAHNAKEQGLTSKFVGKIFVFDERLGERVTSDVISDCHQCGVICDKHTNCKNKSCHVLFIQCQDCMIKYKGYCSTVCQEESICSIKKQKTQHIKNKNNMNIFNKSRQKLQLNIIKK